MFGVYSNKFRHAFQNNYLIEGACGGWVSGRVITLSGYKATERRDRKAADLRVLAGSKGSNDRSSEMTVHMPAQHEFRHSRPLSEALKLLTFYLPDGRTTTRQLSQQRPTLVKGIIRT